MANETTNETTQAEFDALVQHSIQQNKPVDLSNKALTGVKAKGYHLYKANFTNTRLINCDFTETDLRYAKLDACYADRCKFDAAHLEYSTALSAVLQDCDFRQAVVQYAKFDDAMLQRTHWNRAYMAFASFKGANLSYADMGGADCTDADFSGCTFLSATLQYTSFERSNLSDTRFPLAVMNGTQLLYAKLHHASFRTSNLCYIGTDSRNYHFYIYKNSQDGKVYIRAGCRHMLLTAARKHWENRHHDDLYVHEDCLSLVDRALKMARALTWLPTRKPATTKGKKK